MRQNMSYNPGYYQLREMQLRRMVQVAEQGQKAAPGGVVFYGDSITELAPCEQALSALDTPVYNCGIAGATTDMLLMAVEACLLVYKPRLVVLMVGTNDMGGTLARSPRQIALRIKQLVEVIVRNSDSRVMIFSALPCDESKQGISAGRGMRSNDFLRLLFALEQELIADDRVSFVDVYPAFVGKDGAVNKELLSDDGLHPNQKGFEVLIEELRPMAEGLSDKITKQQDEYFEPNRESLEALAETQALIEAGDPGYDTLADMLDAMGLEQ